MAVEWLLINPPASSDRSQIAIPLNLLILSSVIKRAGGQARVLDLDYSVKTGRLALDDQFFKRVWDTMADLTCTHIGITTMCSNYPVILEMAKELKERFRDRTVILGGPQATAVAEETMELCPYVDLVVCGEGERTVEELVRNDFRHIEMVRGVCYRGSAGVVRLPDQEMIGDLDTVPIPDYDAVPIDEYVAQIANTDNPVFPIEAGRGCPYNCTFCSTSMFWKRKYRVKSPERIAAEMRYVHGRWGVTKFDLVHDNLLFDTKYRMRLCDVFDKELAPDVQWVGASRIDHIAPEVLSRLKAGHCTGLFFGVETGSRRMQRLIRKGLKVETVPDQIRLVSQAGMGSTVSFILGFPEETPEDTESTLNLALECKINGAKVDLQVLSPVYGSDLFTRFGEQAFWAESIQPRSAMPTDRLSVASLVRSNKELFAFYYGFPNPYLEYEFIVFVNFLFAVVINNNPEELRRYLDGTRTGLLELANKVVGRVSVRSAITDKMDYFQQVVECYRIVSAEF